MKSYRTLFFDMDGTLLDFDRAEAVGIREVLRRYGLPVTDENAGLYHRVNAKCWQEFEEGILSREQVVVERFHRFFGLKGIQADAAEAETLYRRFLDQSAFLIGGAKELLEELKDCLLYTSIGSAAGSEPYGNVQAVCKRPQFPVFFNFCLFLPTACFYFFIQL